MATLTKEQGAEFYKSLVHKNFTQAAKDVGFGSQYSTDSGLRSAARKMYLDIDRNLAEYGISEDIGEMVRRAIQERKITPNRNIVEVPENELLTTDDAKAIIIAGRNKAGQLLHKKLDRIGRSKQLLDSVSLTQLATTFAIMFDKSQIIKGEATENIAIMARVKTDMTPEESLASLLQMREAASEEKHETASQS
jgi:hypothetical protein